MWFFFFFFFFFLIRNSSRLIKLPYSKVKYNGESCPSIIPGFPKYGEKVTPKQTWMIIIHWTPFSILLLWLINTSGQVFLSVRGRRMMSFYLSFFYFYLPFANWVDYHKTLFIFFYIINAPFFQNAHTVLLSRGVSHTAHRVRSLWCVYSVFWFMCFTEFSTCWFEIEYSRKKNK